MRLLTLILLAASAFGQMPKGSSGSAASSAGLPSCPVASGPCVDGSGNVVMGSTVLDSTWGLKLPITISTTTPITPSVGGFYFCDRAGCTYALPTITTAAIGTRYCFRNSTTRTGALTLTAPASTTIDNDGTATASAGSVASSGALGDAACVVAVSTTQYAFYKGVGTWN